MNRQPFVLIDDSLSPGGDAWLFENPAEIVACDDLRPLATVRR